MISAFNFIAPALMQGEAAKDSSKSFNGICAHHGHVMPPEIDVEFCHSSLDFKTIAEIQLTRMRGIIEKFTK